MYKELIEYLENKIKRCDEFGDMSKEKWAFQTTLKEVRKLSELDKKVDASEGKFAISDVSGWLEFHGNENLFNEMAKKNCPCRYDDGTQGRYNDKQPTAMLTHFKIV
jgi:hypothetical protein